MHLLVALMTVIVEKNGNAPHDVGGPLAALRQRWRRLGRGASVEEREGASGTDTALERRRRDTQMYDGAAVDDETWEKVKWA